MPNSELTGALSTAQYVCARSGLFFHQCLDFGISLLSGRTLKENGLVEVEVIEEVTSRLVVNRAAMKTRGQVVPLVEAFRRAVAEREAA